MSGNNLTSGFIDLATFDELEKYLYGGGKAVTYFGRETRKSTWFTQVPTTLNIQGRADFGSDWFGLISRSGDYLLQTWIELTLPAVTFKQGAVGTGLRWSRNLMHHLVSCVELTAADLSVCSFNSYYLDFWAAFTTPASKQVGYDRMIGNVPALTQPVAQGGTLPETILALPLPLFFTRDSGVSLPTAALPYVTMQIKVLFKDWTKLLTVDNINAPVGTNPSRPATVADVVTAPALTHVKLYGNYAIVSNDERKRMGCAPRDILMEQVQHIAPQAFSPSIVSNLYSLPFSHAVKTLFFAVVNKTTDSQHAIYVNTSPLPSQILGTIPTINYDTQAPSATDPIKEVSMLYENSKRLDRMSSLYYSAVQPYYQPNGTIPLAPGLHMYSYSLDFLSCDPKGSTNYGKLTDVLMEVCETVAAQEAQAGTLPLPTDLVFPSAWIGGNWWKQVYAFVAVVTSNNILRVSGGSLGYPVL
jgi:hypothetical protein